VSGGSLVKVSGGSLVKPAAAAVETIEPFARYALAITHGVDRNGDPEPYRAIEADCRDAKGRPRSVWTSILRMPAAERERMALEWMGLTRQRDRAQVMGECVLYDATKTNKVSVWRDAQGEIVRWSVWIDPKGQHRLEVWP
jgi:hypothetical protein